MTCAEWRSPLLVSEFPMAERVLGIVLAIIALGVGGGFLLAFLYMLVSFIVTFA